MPGGLTMPYAERRERKKGVRYRGIYKAADGRYRSADTFSTEKQALAVAEEAERHAAEVAGGAAGGLDPATRATRTIREYAPVFLRHHQVEGNTKDTYADTLRLHVIPFLGGPSSSFTGKLWPTCGQDFGEDICVTSIPWSLVARGAVQQCIV